MHPHPSPADLWLLDATGVTTRSLDMRVLDAVERERAAGFAREHDRARYVLAHTALRLILGRRLGTDPADLVFDREPCPGCRGPHGRPRLATPGGPWFSLSHGGDRVLIGVAPVPIGVDVEPVPAPATTTELTAVLHPAEQADLAAVPPAHRAEEFARLWTRKEAYLKGLGTGLGRPLASDYLGTTGRAPHPPGWIVTDVAAGPGHAAALAVRRAEGNGQNRMHHRPADDR